MIERLSLGRYKLILQVLTYTLIYLSTNNCASVNQFLQPIPVKKIPEDSITLLSKSSTSTYREFISAWFKKKNTFRSSASCFGRQQDHNQSSTITKKTKAMWSNISKVTVRPATRVKGSVPRAREGDESWFGVSEEKVAETLFLEKNRWLATYCVRACVCVCMCEGNKASADPPRRDAFLVPIT